MLDILIVTAVGFTLSLLLVAVHLKFSVESESDLEFGKYLPGYNCGACGFNTCDGMSEAMLDDPLNYKKCRPLRGDKLKEMEAYLRSKKII